MYTSAWDITHKTAEMKFFTKVSRPDENHWRLDFLIGPGSLCLRNTTFIPGQVYRTVTLYGITLTQEVVIPVKFSINRNAPRFTPYNMHYDHMWHHQQMMHNMNNIAPPAMPSFR